MTTRANRFPRPISKRRQTSIPRHSRFGRDFELARAVGHVIETGFGGTIFLSRVRTKNEFGKDLSRFSALILRTNSTEPEVACLARNRAAVVTRLETNHPVSAMNLKKQKKSLGLVKSLSRRYDTCA